jgi:hypothetical protein
MHGRRWHRQHGTDYVRCRRAQERILGVFYISYIPDPRGDLIVQRRLTTLAAKARLPRGTYGGI